MESCENCQHFVGDPLALEKELPGLNILSSALGSVRGETGWCRLKDVFFLLSHHCVQYVPA
jgi:hypothetical protein